MAARAAMAHIIQKVKDIVDVEDLTDEAIERYLDNHKYYADGENPPSLLYSDYPWYNFTFKYGNIESDSIVQSASGTTVTPTSAYWLRGHFYFTTAYEEQLYLKGWFYDSYMAAKDIFLRNSGGASSFSRGRVNVSYYDLYQRFDKHSIFAGEQSADLTRGTYEEIK